MADLNQSCVAQILLGLSVPVLRALSGLMDVYLAQAQAVVANLQAQLGKAQIALIPVNLAFGVVNQALAQAESIVNLLPTSAIEQCDGIGEFMEDIRGGIDSGTRDLQEIQLDLNRKLSAVDELEARIDTTNQFIEDLNVFKLLLDEAIAAQS